MELNQSRNEPSEEYFSKINSILKYVKKDIKNKRRKRK
jgi:hypothetical protein